MSATSTANSSSSSIQTLFTVALKDYTRQTGDDLATHPFSTKIQACDSVDSITAVLREQADAFHSSRQGDRNVLRWLEPIINVVNVLSGILGEGVSLVFPPAKVIFAGVGVLLTAAKDVNTSYDALDDLFESIGHFLTRVKIYSEVPSSPAISEIVAKIMVELLSVLALATKQIKQNRLKNFGKKIFGEKDIESVLQRLDRLTQEEARMTVAQTLEVLHGLVNNIKVVMDDGKASVNSFKEALVTMEEIAGKVNKLERDRLQEAIWRWLSPPDPSKNHNIACKALHSGTATWFIQGKTFGEWKTAGPLLWVHGKPGSGKSILCSAAIQNVKTLRKTGLASLAFFYFDFNDTRKQDPRSLLSSLLVQLSTWSDHRSAVLSNLYEEHKRGAEQPSDDALLQCLKDILELPRQGPTYIVVDALDESPNTSGLPSPRDQVVSLVETLVNLQNQDLHIFVTSRPEADIRAVLEPLTTFCVSLHEENGQSLDIINYVNSVVHSDRRMSQWREEDKQLVIDTLLHKADGMFRWVYCQLERLRHCIPASIRRILSELPSTLDGTYERVLRDIHEDNWEYAHRIFQCLLVASRPLLVEELAEILTLRFDGGTIPGLEEGWRPEDGEGAVMLTCSSLITIVKSHGTRVVQFSHFSVKEFLTSTRLATKEGILRYHILLQPAHILLAQASLSILLHLDSHVDKNSVKKFPLVHYAARHWVDHARFEDTSLRIRDGMERIFRPRGRHFSIWVWLYNVDDSAPIRSMATEHPILPKGTTLHYAALCGFYTIVEWLVVTHSQDVNAKGNFLMTPLHHVSYRGYLELARFFLEHGADVDASAETLGTPLCRAAVGGQLEVAKLLLEHGADVNGQHDSHGTPLHQASFEGHLEVVRLLLQHSADLNSRDGSHRTPLAQALMGGHQEVVQLLLDCGATANFLNDDGWTRLVQCQKCQKSFPRQQELYRHLLSHFPYYLYCPSPRCSWRGDRLEAFRKHWNNTHTDEGPAPMRKQIEIYDTNHVVEWITRGEMSVDDAAAYALSLVEAKIEELGKQDVWEDLWGRRDRRMTHHPQ